MAAQNRFKERGEKEIKEPCEICGNVLFYKNCGKCVMCMRNNNRIAIAKKRARIKAKVEPKVVNKWQVI